MTQPIHSDPEHLRKVVDDMVRFSRDLAGQMDALENSLSALGRTWEDQQFQDFRQLVQRTIRPVRTLYDELKQQRAQMEADIEKLRAFQNARIG